MAAVLHVTPVLHHDIMLPYQAPRCCHLYRCLNSWALFELCNASKWTCKLCCCVLETLIYFSTDPAIYWLQLFPNEKNLGVWNEKEASLPDRTVGGWVGLCTSGARVDKEEECVEKLQQQQKKKKTSRDLLQSGPFFNCPILVSNIKLVTYFLKHTVEKDIVHTLLIPVTEALVYLGYTVNQLKCCERSF